VFRVKSGLKVRSLRGIGLRRGCVPCTATEDGVVGQRLCSTSVDASKLLVLADATIPVLRFCAGNATLP